MNYKNGNLISYKTRLEEVNECEVGGKGWNLFRLLHFGFPLPPWFVVSSSVFNEVIREQRGSIEKILCSMDFTNQNSLDIASSLISEIISNSEVTSQFPQELFLTIEKIFSQNKLLSVRSSVIGEDSSENSFAGQMDSFLNVHPSDIIDAIKKVWASAFSSRALVYRHSKNIRLENISTAVIVQEMVQSVASGVLFTVDPENKTKKCVISAGFGLGEGVVHNMVETDTYRIGWQTDEILKEVRKKEYRVVFDQLHGRTCNEVVPLELQKRQVLTDSQIKHLRKCGVKAQQYFNIPQDIEWALDERGNLFILQARPIVFAKQEVTTKAFRIWENSNIVESYPGLTLPLTFSFICKGYESSFRNSTLGFLFVKKAIKKDLHIFKNMIGLLEGRVYYNLLNWYQMLSYLPGFKKHKESWDQMIGISHKVDFPLKKLSPFNYFCSLLIVIWRLLTVKQNSKIFFTHFNSVYSNLDNLNLSEATEEELIKIYETLSQEFTDKWHLTLFNDFCAMKYYDWLKQICNKWGLDKNQNLYNDLLCGENRVESTAPVRSILRLTEMFHEKPIYQALLKEEDDQVVWQRIQQENGYADLKNALEIHMHFFGDRTLEELKLEKPTFREEPASLIKMIKHYYDLELSIETMEKKEQKVRSDAEKNVHLRLKNPFKKLVFWFILRNARLAIANRENMRLARSRLFGITRRLFRRMAKLFVEKGLIESSSDIYYLTVDEIFGFVQGTAVTQSLKKLVNIRKEEYNEFIQHNPKERILTTGIPYHNSLSATESCDGTGKILKGIGCSSGMAKGVAKVIFDPRSAIENSDYILVAKSTDPGWVFLMISSRGIVVEKGSVLSHTAIIGRELGIPTIVGVENATKLIPDGAKISINGITGEIRWQ